MRAGALAVSSFLLAAIALACVQCPSVSSIPVGEDSRRAPPDAYFTVVGFVYETDGMTPVVNCLVNITRKDTGAWGLTMTDGTYGYYSYYTENLGGPPLGSDDVINVTATKGSQIGWNEVLVGNAFIHLWIDVIMSASETSFLLKMVQGWNFVSIPLVDCSYRASTLGLAYGDVVVGWNPSTGIYDHVYIVGISPQAYDFDILSGTGYEIYSATDRELDIRGTAPAGVQTVEVKVPEGGGWIAFGFLGFNSTRRASEVPAMSSVPGSISAVIAFDAEAKAYVSYYPIAPFTDFTPEVGQALWVWCDESGVLSYDP